MFELDHPAPSNAEKAVSSREEVTFRKGLDAA
jgi:hypothetical protein